MKKKQNDLWVTIFLIPFVVGFALISSGIKMLIFVIIGWILFIFSIFTGIILLFGFYKKNKEKILKIMEDLHLTKVFKYLKKKTKGVNKKTKDF